MPSQESTSDNPICMQVFYRGRVQGVGFRYTTTRIARNHQVTGYVRNLGDGRVELVACGAASAVDPFLADVARHFESQIDAIEQQPIQPTERFSRFETRR